jgi:hypothetical protein
MAEGQLPTTWGKQHTGKGKKRGSDADLPPRENLRECTGRRVTKRRVHKPYAVHRPLFICHLTCASSQPSPPSMPLHARKRVPAIRRRFSFANSCNHQPRRLIAADIGSHIFVYRMTAASVSSYRHTKQVSLADLSPACPVTLSRVSLKALDSPDTPMSAD